MALRAEDGEAQGGAETWRWLVVIVVGLLLLTVGVSPTLAGRAPDVGAFRPAGSLLQPRLASTAKLLPDGRVLIVGGTDRYEYNSFGTANVRRAEVWDPTTWSFQPAGDLDERRLDHTATRLPDGRVLVVGGVIGDWRPVPIAEMWEPSED